LFVYFGAELVIAAALEVFVLEPLLLLARDSVGSHLGNEDWKDEGSDAVIGAASLGCAWRVLQFWGWIQSPSAAGIIQ